MLSRTPPKHWQTRRSRFTLGETCCQVLPKSELSLAKRLITAKVHGFKPQKPLGSETKTHHKRRMQKKTMLKRHKYVVLCQKLGHLMEDDYHITTCTAVYGKDFVDLIHHATGIFTVFSLTSISHPYHDIKIHQKLFSNLQTKGCCCGVPWSPKSTA